MSTRSYIAYKDVDGTVKGAFCHYDGYLEHNGKILFEHYNSLERVKKLVALGSLDFLGADLEPSEYIRLYGYNENKNPKEFAKLPNRVKLALIHESYEHVTAYYRDFAKNLTSKEQKNYFGKTMPKPEVDKYNSFDEFWNHSKLPMTIEYFYYYNGRSWKAAFYDWDKDKNYFGSLKYALKHYTKKEN